MKILLMPGLAVALLLGFSGTAFAVKNFNSAKSNTSPALSKEDCEQTGGIVQKQRDGSEVCVKDGVSVKIIGGGSGNSSRAPRPPGDNTPTGVTVPFKPCGGKVSIAPKDPPKPQGSGDPLKGLNVTKGKGKRC